MAKIVSDTVYEPRQLPEAEMKQLAHDVFHQVVAPIFQGISEEEFLMELLSTNRAWVWLQVLKNEQDLPVGFQILSLYEYSFEGKTCDLLRAASGLLPAYRGQNKTTTFWLKKWLWYRMRHPRPRTLLCGRKGPPRPKFRPGFERARCVLCAGHGAQRRDRRCQPGTKANREVTSR